MGLDMYLYIEKYESEYEVEEFEEREKLRDKIMERLYPEEMLPLIRSMDAKRRTTLNRIARYEVGYWRKANAIHNWIIQNCADGTDDCRPIYVDISDVEKLRDTCNEVLRDKSKAPELLPTAEGFFFGGTEYDDWYMEDVRYTSELLTEVLTFISSLKDDPVNVHKSYYVLYEASW